MSSEYICNCKNPKKKETLKNYLCRGFRTGLRRRERSMALFNRVNEFHNKVATLSKWKLVPDRGEKNPKAESLQRSRMLQTRGLAKTLTKMNKRCSFKYLGSKTKVFRSLPGKELPQ